MINNENKTTINLYVATNGNDAWSGTLPEPNDGGSDGPFATLWRAKEAVRELRGVGNILPGPVNVIIRGGTYFLDETLVLGAEDSGVQECQVTYQAYPGEKPILSGGLCVSGWKKYAEGLLRAYLPESLGGFFRTRQLFHRGVRLPRARWPKCDPTDPIRTGWTFPESAVAGYETRAFHFAEDIFPNKWAKPHEGEVNMFCGHGWLKQIIPIDYVDNQQHIIRLAKDTFFANQPPWYMRVGITPDSRFYVENMREDLTEPGEWCYDSSERMLYLKPPADFDPEAVVLPVLDCLIRLRETSWVRFRGLTFTQTAVTGDNYHRNGLLGYGAMFPQPGQDYCGETLHMINAKHCAIENCHFDQVGGNAVYLEQKCCNNQICYNEISYAGANGITLIGTEPFHPLFNKVTDNNIHHVGCILNYVAGVFMGMSDMNIVAHNSLYDLPHHAINLGTNGLGRNIIEFNEIRRVCLEISDTGAINCWGDVPAPGAGLSIKRDSERSGHVIRYNLIVDVPGSMFKNGCVVDDDSTRGIYLDDCTSNCHVYSNIIVRAGYGLQIHGGKHNMVENNLLIDCGLGISCCDWPPLRPGNEQIKGMFTGNCFSHNIVVLKNLDKYVYLLYHWTEFVLAYCDKNVFWQMQGQQKAITSGDSSFVVSNFPQNSHPNVSLVDWQSMGFDQNSVVADPLLVDLIHEDFHLKSNSPALKLGFVQIPFEMIGIRKPG